VLYFFLSQSGISVPDEILTLFESVKIKKAHKYIVFTLEKTGEVAGKSTFGYVIMMRLILDSHLVCRLLTCPSASLHDNLLLLQI
jgi:hypothetical protein